MKKTTTFLLVAATFILTAAGSIFAASSSMGGGMWYDDAGRFAIGSSTPNAIAQFTQSGANATSSIEIGKSGQNKGSCIKLYRYNGAAVYLTVNNSNTLVVSTTACITGL